MPILSSVITKQRNRGNGRLAVFEQHTDHNGDVHEHRYSCPVGYDAAQALIDWQSTLNTSLISSEKESYQSAIEEGADPATLPVKHLTNLQKARRVIKALMLGSPEKMLKAAEYVQGFSNAQIDNFFTVPQRVRIRTRQNFIISNQSIFNSDVREEL